MNRGYSGMRARTWAVASALAATVVAVCMLIGPKDHAAAQGPAVAASGGEQSGATSYAKSLSKAFREAAQKVLPAVVMIKNVPAVHQQAGEQDEGAENPSDDDPFGGLPPELRHFFKQFPQMPHHGMPRGEPSSVGSGVIIDPSGVILTNNHVVDGGGKIKVRLHDGREFDAAEVKTDPKTDLAIVRIKDAGPLPAVKLANSDDVQVGDWVLALGDPFGLEGTVTAGIISAKGRALGNTPRENFIQTDAAINPGNSGGPLVNLDGEAVGINTAIASQSGGYQGVGFAVSSNLAKWVTQQLIAKGSVRRAYLGIGLDELTHQLAKELGAQGQQGVVVREVFRNKPAAAAGVKPGDVIVEFAGKPVASPQDLQQAVEQAPIDASQPLSVLRDGKRITLDVTPREQPANYGLAGDESTTPGNEGAIRDKKLGIEVASVTADLAEKLGIKTGQGVAITKVRNGSPAAMAGLTAGMVIVEVNRQAVKSAEDFSALMEKQSIEKGIRLLVRSAQGEQMVMIRSL